MFLEKIENCVSNGWTVRTKTTDWFEETTDCLIWYHCFIFDGALNDLTAYAPVFKCFEQSLNAIKSLLRFDNKQHLWIYSEKQIWVIRFWTQVFEFFKELRLVSVCDWSKCVE